MMIMMIRIRIKGQCTDLFHLIKIIDTMVGKSMQQSIGFVRPEEFLHSALPFFSRFRGDRHHDDVEDSYDGMLVTMSIMVAMMMLVMMMQLRRASMGFAFMAPRICYVRLSLRICTNPPPLPPVALEMVEMMMFVFKFVLIKSGDGGDGLHEGLEDLDQMTIGIIHLGKGERANDD